MNLDALAPDQRAVVQLVLQQERSYEEIAELLGISAEAVRDRAHRGVDRLAPAEDLDAEDRAAVADYLLGQQPLSRREATRALLASSPEARDWANAVAEQLRDVARSPLPGIPEAAADGDEIDGREATVAAAPKVRARPRPQRATGKERAPAAPAKGRSSMLGGALLIGGVAVLLIILVVWLVTHNGGDDTSTATSEQASPTPTATATPAFQPIGDINLTGAGDAKGTMTIFASSGGALAFQIQGTGMPATKEGQAYAVWLTGGDAPHRLGFAPPVGSDGEFGTSGPRENDAASFPQWLAQAKRIVVSLETDQDAARPAKVVLSGRVPSGSSSGG